MRFALTTEAGLNDGLAFPFVYLGLLVAAEGLSPVAWGAGWFLQDVLYRTVVGAGIGWLGARLLGIVLFSVPRNAVLADTAAGVLALAGIVLCYGSAELAEGYGFIAVAVMGLTLRRIEEDHSFHRRLHDFSESIEHALTALLLVALGSVLPRLFADLSWTHLAVALILLLLIRPLAGWLALLGTGIDRRDRAVMAIYGVRGIGSIYYLAYASSHVQFADEAEIWTLVALVILLSTVLHGFSVGRAVDRLDENES
ncbi:cation:proton antiporter domain-containing protein [Mangrovicoccus algicola]|uniref:cation:proton antiporter domain-containing protein n=1 Tax=Mangrovicoccus algicola TaxID=2771008 RepID=UPI002ED7FDF6